MAGQLLYPPPCHCPSLSCRSLFHPLHLLHSGSLFIHTRYDSTAQQVHAAISRRMVRFDNELYNAWVGRHSAGATDPTEERHSSDMGTSLAVQYRPPISVRCLPIGCLTACFTPWLPFVCPLLPRPLPPQPFFAPSDSADE